MPTSTWSSIKPNLQRLSQDDLLHVVHDLYALNANNKAFLATRFAAALPDDLTKPYRQVISACFNPQHGLPSFKIAPARKALDDFKKANTDPLLTLDLMLFYVEQGVIGTNTYGDIHDAFYESLSSVYADAAKLAETIGDRDLLAPYLQRFSQIVRDTRSIGWGFHDDLNDIYTETLILHTAP